MAGTSQVAAIVPEPTQLSRRPALPLELPSRGSSLNCKQEMNSDPDHERVRVRSLHFILQALRDTESRSLREEKTLSELRMKDQYDGNYRMQLVSLS